MLSHTHAAGFAVADATTLPFLVSISRNSAPEPLGFNTTATRSPALA
jgi:hypothetical protein